MYVQYRPTHKKHLLPPRMQAQFLNSPFLIASQEYCTYFLSPPFLVSSAEISSHFLRQSLHFSSPFCGRCHSQDEFSLPVLLHFTGVPLFPTLTLFEKRVGVESVSCTGTCVPSVQTGGHFLFPRPTPYLVSYHREHDIDRFLASPFLLVLLLLSAILTAHFLFLK